MNRALMAILKYFSNELSFVEFISGSIVCVLTIKHSILFYVPVMKSPDGNCLMLIKAL
jgi:hypothetical protein